MYVITVDEVSCKGCGDCSSTCPVEMFAISNMKAQVAGNPDDCLGCESCVSVCATASITLQEM